MGKKKAILHIGLQKTGTSSIQVMLASSEAYLNRIGYTYPSLPASDNPKSSVWTSPFRHNCIAGTYADFNSVFEKLTSSEARNFWLTLRESSLIPILSAEEFSRQKNFSPVAEAIAGIELHVIVYLRRQDQYIESLYNQRNKILFQRGDVSLLTDKFLTEDDVFDFVKVSGYTPILDYMNLIERIRSQLSPGKITIRNFSRASLIDRDVCADFCRVVDIDQCEVVRPASEANQSISNRVLLNWKQARIEKGEQSALDFVTLENEKITQGANLSGDYSLLSDKTRVKILDTYRRSNLEIEKEFGIFFE